MRCAICKTREGVDFVPNCYPKRVILHEHHIIPRIAIINNNRGNKVFICTTCHGKIHSLYQRRAFELLAKNDPDFFTLCFEELRGEKNSMAEVSR